MRICSVTPHQLLNNPRILKEAAALSSAGHEVRVVAVKKLPEQSALEASAAEGGGWRLQTIDIERTAAGRWNWFKTGARQKAALAAWRMVGRGRLLAGLAYTRTFSETVRLITAERTDLVIAHAQPMLAPAWFAARRLGCRWGFDCEDILSEEYADRAHQALIRYAERTFIPEADYVTLASSEFSRWLADRYGVTDGVFVANVPSLEEAPEAVRPGYPDARPYLSLYWFSMSIGPMRGLEDAIRALPLIDVPVELHLRGRLLPGYERELRALAAAVNASDRLVVHDLVAPGDVVTAAADHDVGLVLSQPCCDNHEMWMPNKLYAYLMAGLAIAASATRGHRAALAAAPGVGFEYQPGNYTELAARLSLLAVDPHRLRACRDAAFRAARVRFNWETEQARLLDVIDSLAPQAPRSRALHAVRA